MIVAVALKDKEGNIFSMERPARFHDLLAFLIEQGFFAPETYQQGFLNDQGVFFSREDALMIALKNNQIISNKTVGFLEVSDLWEERLE
ncbi:hypothetical protein H6775_03735 [Candidatus Nomurabacteria bacterium]|nr:hypothetical protein [Candidatus Nomurabacteria bacterium]